MPKVSRSRKAPVLPLYADDFLSAVIGMDAEARGVYITLLAMQWNKGALRLNPRKLALACGCSEETFVQLWKEELAEKFEERDGSILNLRLEKERQRVEEYRRD